MSENETKPEGNENEKIGAVEEVVKPRSKSKKTATVTGTEGLKQGRATLKVHPEQAIIIGVDTEHKRGEHELWDERSFWPLDKKQIDFTATNGIMEPPELRYEEGVGLTVVDGRRRFLHLRAANAVRVANGLPEITEVECFVVNTPMSVSRVNMWAKNIHRENETLLSKCRKVAMALKSGVAVEEVMDIFKATSKATVDKWKKIANLPDEFQALIEKHENGQGGGMSAEAALAHHKAGKPAEVVEVKPAKEPKEAKEVNEPAADAASAPKKGKKGKKTLKATPKKGSAAEALGKRGKKWFKSFVDTFGEYLPDEFKLGIMFAIQAVEDADLPKPLYAQVIGYKAVIGQETEEEEKAMPAYMRKQVEKILRKQLEG